MTPQRFRKVTKIFEIECRAYFTCQRDGKGRDECSRRCSKGLSSLFSPCCKIKERGFLGMLRMWDLESDLGLSSCSTIC